jgi:hypothetical protein
MQVSASVNYHVQKDEAQAFEFDVNGIIGSLSTCCNHRLVPLKSSCLTTPCVSMTPVLHAARREIFTTTTAKPVRSNASLIMLAKPDVSPVRLTSNQHHN